MSFHLSPKHSRISLSDAAHRYAAAGLSIIPIRADGSKSPAIGSWAEYQSRIAAPDEIDGFFDHEVGIAIIGGAVSGGLEVMDFDKPDIYGQWFDDVVAQSPGLAEVVQSLPLVSTPAAGTHLYYRCALITGSQKLAVAATPFADPQGKLKTVMIETRGEGGYVLAPPSPAACHRAGKPYLLVHGDLESVPTITPEQRAALHAIARTYHELEPAAASTSAHPEPSPQSASDTRRPGDDYNERISWGELLEPYGWKNVGHRGEKTFWRRPGKTDGISATTGHCGDKLYIFSSNAAPFECRAYDKFAAYVLLAHQGDFKAATKALGQLGYGEPPKARQGDPGALEPPPDDTPHTVETENASIPSSPPPDESTALAIYDPLPVQQEEPKKPQHDKLRALSIAEAIELWSNREDQQFVATPVRALNAALGGGWPVAQASTILAYTGGGKTEFARQSAIVAAGGGHGVLHCDIELGYVRLMERTISQASGIPPTHLRDRQNMGREECNQLERVISQLRLNQQLRFFCPGGAPSLSDLEKIVTAEIQEMPKDPPPLLILDSVQRLALGVVAESQRLQVQMFMDWVTGLAKRLNVACLLISEQRRGADGKIPTAADALTSGAESRALEFQSDVMLALVPEEQELLGDACDADEVNERQVQILICKNRTGSGFGFIRDTIIFEAPCWGMRVEHRREADIEELVFDALGWGPNAAKGLTTVQKEIKKRRIEIARALRVLASQGKIVQCGELSKPKYYRIASQKEGRNADESSGTHNPKNPEPGQNTGNSGTPTL